MLPAGLTLDEEREACRALKGSMLRQEVYALDGVGEDADYPFGHPYTVTEQNFTVRAACKPSGARNPPRGLLHPPARGAHLPLRAQAGRPAHPARADAGGGRVRQRAEGRRDRLWPPPRRARPGAPDGGPPETAAHPHHCHREHGHQSPSTIRPGDYRTPLPAEARTYELRKPQQEASANGPTALYRFDDLLGHVDQAGDGAHDVDYEDIGFEAAAADPAEGQKYFRRLIEHVRTLLPHATT